MTLNDLRKEINETAKLRTSSLLTYLEALESRVLSTPKEEVKYITVKEAQKFSRISRRTIYNWMNSGKLLFSKMPSGRRLIKKSDLIKEAEMD